MVRKRQEVSRLRVSLRELASECENPDEFMVLLSDLKKSLMEKALDAEMDHTISIIVSTSQQVVEQATVVTASQRRRSMGSLPKRRLKHFETVTAPLNRS